MTEREMTKADWIALHAVVEMGRQICLFGIDAIRPEMLAALKLLSPTRD